MALHPTPTAEDELRDPSDFEQEHAEDTVPTAPIHIASRPIRPRMHHRAGTGTNLSVHSISTRKTSIGLGRRTLGLCLMLLTISMWTISNFIASSIFADDTYSKPFFVTWVNVGMFSFFLIGPLTRKALQRTNIIPSWSRQRGGATVYALLGTEDGLERGKPTDDDGDEGDSSHVASTQASRESLILDESMVLSTHGFKPEEPEKLNLYETARLSLEFCVLWFLSNYLVSACLQYTTVASATVLGSTSSVFTLGFGALLGVEPFTLRKTGCVALCLIGVIMISQVDLSGGSDSGRGSFPEKSSSEMGLGDILALGSALGYGLYTILLKKRVGDENRMDVFVFFGFIGVWDLLLLWPFLFIMHWTGIETFEAPPSGQIWWVIIANGFISLISDVSWTYSMLLTSPLVITVGLSLAIPMSLLGQMVVNQQTSSILYWIGSAVVTVSFVIINQESKKEAELTDSAIASAAAAPTIVVADGDTDLEEARESTT